MASMPRFCKREPHPVSPVIRTVPKVPDYHLDRKLEELHVST